MSYLPLCHIELQHQYFSDGLAQRLYFISTAKTLRHLQNAQLVFKATKQGAVLLLDTSRRDISAACCVPNLTLFFLLFSQDPLFGSYSLPLLNHQQFLYCDNQAPMKEAASLRLHSQPELCSEDVVGFDDERLAEVRLPTGKPLPSLVLRLDFTAEQIQQLTEDNFQSYLLRFASRQTIWRYYLSGNSFEQPLKIQDASRQTSFTRQGDMRLSNGRMAQVFDSDQPLQLYHISPYRFQLISTMQGREKILIKRLPVALAGQIDKAVINGVPSNVSEIYLNY